MVAVRLLLTLLGFSAAQGLVSLQFLTTTRHTPWRSTLFTPHRTVPKRTALLSKADKEPKEGYKFGDLTRNLARQATDKVNELTGKDTYEFGDLARFLDGRAKERVQAIKGQQSDYRYEIGDFTRWADALAKEKAAQFAGKDQAADYQVGDISRTLIRKVWTGEYSLDDVFLALRVLAMAGYTLLPIARLLPIQALIPLINASLARDVGGRLTQALAVSLDARMKEALTGNANYQLGDATKDRLQQELARFTGKSSYAVGDLARHVVERGATKILEKTVNAVGQSQGNQRLLSLPDSLTKDLERWDLSFLDKEGAATKDVASWDKYLKEQHKKGA